MEHIYSSKLTKLGYTQLICDIFPKWEDVKDEILVPDRKSGTGNGTIHVFLGAADNELRKEFPSYYQAVEKGEDPSVGAIEVKHYFLASNVLSMLGYVCQYYYSKGQSPNDQVKSILSLLSSYPSVDGLLETTSLFKLSTGSNKLRPYFKQFDANGVFTKLIRQLLLPNSGYKISLYKNSKGEYAAFWLIGFDWQTDFEANSNKSLFTEKQAHEDIVHPRQQIFYGAPGTGKSFEINRITKNKQVIRTTFHPDSDYSTFVGAYKPTSIEIPVRDVTGKVIVENGKQVTENRIVYEFVEQAFLQAYTKAWLAYANKADGEKAKEQYLVIEEINRGNCAQIFGDLFQLLDRNGYGFSDYPITADKDMKKQLAKAFKDLTIADAERINGYYEKNVVDKDLSGDILLLPDNLFIWATMNTSDQSLFPIDSAFKRRWDWKYMPICEGKENGVSLGWKIKVKGHLYDWWQFVEKINAEINEQTKSEDKKLGYFFCKAQNGIVSAETFVSKVIFYLWNDVFKDQAFGSDIFRDGEEELTFNSFYDVDANGKAVVKEDKVELFLQNLGVEVVDETADNSDGEEVIDDEAEELIEGGEGNSKHKSLKSVSFPDGTVFSVNNMTHFEVYLEALKKMGLDLVYPLISNMKYKRKGCPLMSTEEQPGIVNSNYNYQIEGGYYIVKGAMDDTLINVLDELNNQLNLGVQVNYE